MIIGLLVLIGLPGSGKTTFYNFLKDIYKHYVFIHVCYDNLISEEGYKDVITWKAHRKEVIQITRNLIGYLLNNRGTVPEKLETELPHLESSSKLIIVLDDNMYYRSMRYSYYQLAREFEIGFCQIFLKCSVDQALFENEKRIDKVPETVIRAMDCKIEPPNMENNWERLSITLHAYSYTDCVPVIWELLDKSLANPIMKEENLYSITREDSKVCCKTSLVHQVDITLRKIINNKLKVFMSYPMYDRSALQLLSKQLNDTKTKFISGIKNGTIIINQDDILNEVDNASNEHKPKLNEYLLKVFQ